MERREKLVRMFIDYTNFNGVIAHPDDFTSLREILDQLHPDCNWSFSLIREEDCDSGMELKCTDGVISVCGVEDSRDRGSFGFVMLGKTNSSDLVRIQNEEIPRYATTDDIELAKDLAFAFGAEGKLSRKVNWHITTSGMHRPFKNIPEVEIFRADGSDELLTVLKKVGAL